MDVYLDNNATTKPLDSVVVAMEDCLTDAWANPSSHHLPGRRARARIEKAREAVAALIGCKSPTEVVFTSGGTESISQAFSIADHLSREETPFIVVSAVEHAAVLQAAESRRARGSSVQLIRVDDKGNLDCQNLCDVLGKAPKGTFVSLILANNETGVIFRIKEVAELCRSYGARLHVDAVQAIGKIPVKACELECDYLSMSAHKFHGPKGIGALYIRHGTPKMAIIEGHQENGMRGGTENVPGIIGMGVSADAVLNGLEEDIRRMSTLRDRLEIAILSAMQSAEVNGNRDNRLCNTSNISFPGKDSAVLVEQLSARGVHVSAGAACTTGGQPSHVLRAMGLSEERANSSLRFSVSKLTTDNDIETAAAAVIQVLASSLDVHNIR